MKQHHRFDLEPYTVRPRSSVRLKELRTEAPPDLVSRIDAQTALAEDIAHLAAAQELIWASSSHSVLIILQAMDAAGKDGTIKHVMSGVNPQGCSVHSFKAPTDQEVAHHFLWRPIRALPGRGRIAIFNRSYYEEVLVTRVHPKFLERQAINLDDINKEFWETRYEDINNFEHTLTRGGTCIIKIFLHLSKGEQFKRFMERLNDPEKHWKFSPADVDERALWKQYRRAYEAAIEATSTPWAPWYIVPADDKWFTRACVADIITSRIAELDLRYPVLNQEQKQALEQARARLQAEGRGQPEDD
jgi:PPK2 family polyphosphate:nucleotide phosphotransferase